MMELLGGAPTSQAGTTLGVDGIREYKVVTNSFSAEYGQTMGSQMIIVSKGGTNLWHGDVFEYLRNSALDARNFFDTPASSGGRRLPEFRRNNFGGSFGGPIRKDKTFFYAVYEGLRQNLGVTTVDTVPPAACHNLVNPNTNNATLANPTACQSTLTSTTVIPQVIQPLLALFPNPNLPGNQYTFPATNRASVNYGQIRVDQNFSSSDSFFSRYTLDDGSQNNALAYLYFRTLATSRNQFWTLAENHIFSPTVLNTARLSFSRTGSVDANIYNNLPGIGPLNSPQFQFSPGLPIGSIAIGNGGATTLGGNVGFGPPTDVERQNIYTLSDDVYYTRGKHALKFGALINRYNEVIQGALRREGQINFNDLQSFMRGLANGWTVQVQNPISDRNYFLNTLGFYVQDDWRTTSRLTLNLGLRYEFMTTPRETNGRGFAFRDIRTNPQPQNPVVRNYSLRNFSPRVGFAYDPTGKGKTSIRSAFGLYYDVGNLGVTLEQNLLGTPPLSNTCTSTFPASAPELITIPLSVARGNCSTMFTTQYNANQPKTLQYNLTVEQQLPGGIGLSVSYVGLRGIHLWTDREGNPVRMPDASINASIVNSIEYWGSNIVTPPAGSSSVVGCANTDPHGNPPTPTCRVNPNWAAATFINTSGDSWYNSLQVVLNKRLGRGLEFQSAYTWGKALDTTQSNMDANDCSGSSGGATGYDPEFPKNDKGPSCTDVLHNWRFSLLYHFPNIQSNKFAAKLLHGWWIGNIVSVQSGYPFTPLLTTNRSQSGVLNGLTGQGDRPDFGTGPNTVTISGKTYNFIPYDSGKVITGDPNQWFNPLMFAMQPMVPCPNNSAVTCGRLGTASRNALRAPGLGNWDFSVVKETALPFLGEKGNLQFRAEFFNLLNRANFGFPNAVVFTGKTTDIGAYSEAPSPTAGQIRITSTTSRQIQLALKIIF